MVKMIKYFLIILIPPIIILGNFNYLIFNSNYYQKLYSKIGVYETFGNKEVVNEATNNLLGYFRGKNKLDYNFYSEQAQLHLKDVRELITLANNFFVLTFIVALVSSVVLLAKSHRLFLKALFFSSTFTLLAILALSLGLLSFFDPFFLKFHQVLFDNQAWLFPAEDNLIKLFPPTFFVAFANRLAQNIIFTSLIILSVSTIFLKKAKR